jgi:hypothetical protein
MKGPAMPKTRTGRRLAELRRSGAAGRHDPQVPVGVDGIARHLGVSQNTVVTWRRRSKEWVNVEKFPDPAGQISGKDWWWLTDILDWAKATGRLKEETRRHVEP